MKNSYINLSFNNNPKLSVKLTDKKGLCYYKKIKKESVSVIEKYTFFLPDIKRNYKSDFLILQCNKFLFDLSSPDGNFLIHYGLKDLRNFKVYLHYSFFGKIVDIVIFQYNGKFLYGILYNNYIYYEPEIVSYSDAFDDFQYLLTGNNFNKKYKVCELKEQKFYLNDFQFIDEKLNVKLHNPYFVKKIDIEQDVCDYNKGKKYLNITNQDMNFLKKFYINEHNTYAISFIREYDKNILKYIHKMRNFFVNLRIKDEKMNVFRDFYVQYCGFDFYDYSNCFEPSLLKFNDDLIDDLSIEFEILKNKYYNLSYKNK